MGKINYGRVLLGGVAAGVALFVLDFLGMFVTGMDWEAWLARFGLQEPPMAMFAVTDLLFGIMLVWMYAAIRPRFGAGIRTALIPAAFFWLFFGLVYWSFTAMGMFTQGEFAMSAAWGAVTLVVASVVGAWLYREEGGALSTT